jgi:hypothetical protein
MTRLLAKPFKDNCELKGRFEQRAREYLGVENPAGKPEREIGQLSKERVKTGILRQAAGEAVYTNGNRSLGRRSELDIFGQNIQNALQFVDQREEVILHQLDRLRSQISTDCQ